MRRRTFRPSTTRISGISGCLTPSAVEQEALASQPAPGSAPKLASDLSPPEKSGRAFRCCQRTSQDSLEVRAFMRAVVRDAGRAGEQFEPRTSSDSSAGDRGKTATARAEFYNGVDRRFRARFDEPDLLDVRIAARMAIAERRDRNEITQAQADLEYAQIHSAASGNPFAVRTASIIMG